MEKWENLFSHIARIAEHWTTFPMPVALGLMMVPTRPGQKYVTSMPYNLLFFSLTCTKCGQYSGNTQFFGNMSIWEHIQRSHKYFIQQQIKIQILWHTISWHTIISKYTFWIYKYLIIQYFNIHYEYLDIQTFQNTIFRHSCYYVIIHTYIKSTHYFKDSKTSSNLT